MIYFNPFLKLLIYDGNEERSQKMVDHFHCVSVIKSNIEKNKAMILKEVDDSYDRGVFLYQLDKDGLPYQTTKNSIDYITERPKDILIHINYYKDKYEEKKKELEKSKINKKKKKKNDKNQPRQLSLF